MDHASHIPVDGWSALLAGDARSEALVRGRWGQARNGSYGRKTVYPAD